MDLGRPSLETVWAVFPHTALQLVVALEGLDETTVGFPKTAKATRHKVLIRPTLMRR